MKSGAIAVFVKTPGYSPVNSSLVESVGKQSAEIFYKLSCDAIAAVVNKIVKDEKTASITPYWVVAESTAMKNPLWNGFSRIAQGDGPLGERLARLYNELLEKHDFVVFLWADSPQITINLLEEAVNSLKTSDRFILGPVEDGRIYLFGGSQAVDSKIWTSVPYGDWQTAELLKKKLVHISGIKELLSLFDIEAAEDMMRLHKFLVNQKELLPEQKTLQNWLKCIKSEKAKA